MPQSTTPLASYFKTFASVKSRFEKGAPRDPEIICRAGPHMNCAVLKLQKQSWTNDDLTKMGNHTGIFFSIWISEKSSREQKAKYNIHAMSVRSLKSYRLTGQSLAKDFRGAFKKVQKSWPNVSTHFGCCTLMEGHWALDPKSLALDALNLMSHFELELAPLIDGFLKEKEIARQRPMKK